MARRPRPTLADYAVIGISPALIMFLIGSLVFFLITVFYQGQFDVRLSFIMAMFIMGTVSIARISIEQGREYAALFALPLAGVTLFAMFRFVEFGGAYGRLSGVFNIGLIAMIWFCADKLTWDCTVIDENQDRSGQGLLQTGGLEDEQPAAETEAASDDPHETPAPVASGLWQRFVEHRHRPHAPGIWVIYFSIAALPIFGFGQLFLRDEASRRYAFKLLVIYVGAALGLLLTTSFLGLRRYLRQRRLEMPIEMAGTWLGVGAAMIVALLLICMVMPRRNAEYSVSDLSFLSAPIDLPVSDWAVGNDGQQQEDAQRKVKRDDAAQQMEGQQGAGGQTQSEQGEGGEKSKASGQSGQKKSGKRSQGDAGKGQQKKSSQNKTDQQNSRSQTPGKQPDGGRPQGKPPEGEQADPNSSEQGPEAARNESPDDQEPGDPAEPDDPANAPDRTEPSRDQNQDRSPKQSRSQSQSEQSQSEQSQNDQSSSSNNRGPNPTNPLSSLSPTLGGILKALYWLIAIAVIGYLVWKNWEQVRHAVRNFIKAMRDLWERLFGGQPGEDETEAVEAIATSHDWRPFSDFSDPFVSGRAERWSTEELISYTFEAFEAWGRENGCGRLAEQTPIEFAKEAVRAHGGLGKDAMRVAELYNWTAFGKTSVPDANREYLRRFWQELSACAIA